jgi:uncharacterized cupredoxin-like copper-binding protein
MPRPFRFAVVLCVLALLAAACGGGDDAASTTSTEAGETTSSTTKAPATTTTQPGDAGASTLTFNGTECIQAGPSEVGSFVQYALRNDASADVVMMFLQITDTSLEDLVSDVERFPPINQWPTTVGHELTETVTTKVVESGDAGSLAVSFKEPGQYGAVCWPLDGSPAIPGGLLTVEG